MFRHMEWGARCATQPRRVWHQALAPAIEQLAMALAADRKRSCCTLDSTPLQRWGRHRLFERNLLAAMNVFLEEPMVLLRFHHAGWWIGGEWSHRSSDGIEINPATDELHIASTRGMTTLNLRTGKWKEECHTHESLQVKRGKRAQFSCPVFQSIHAFVAFDTLCMESTQPNVDDERAVVIPDVDGKRLPPLTDVFCSHPVTGHFVVLTWNGAILSIPASYLLHASGLRLHQNNCT